MPQVEISVNWIVKMLYLLSVDRPAATDVAGLGPDDSNINSLIYTNYYVYQYGMCKNLCKFPLKVVVSSF